MMTEIEMAKKIFSDIPTMTDKQVCTVFNKTPWRSDLWNEATNELRKRGIGPVEIKQILAKA